MSGRITKGAAPLVVFDWLRDKDLLLEGETTADIDAVAKRIDAAFREARENREKLAALDTPLRRLSGLIEHSSHVRPVAVLKPILDDMLYIIRPTGAIRDACPICQRSFEWDAENDHYRDAMEHDDTVVPKSMNGEERRLSLFICPADGAVIAVYIVDEFGGEVFVPSQKAL
jgi:hypothetical protein